MSYVFGVVAFALALLISIAWHELGHHLAAKATGMKVRRFFVGFGPTVWSTHKGETEYGLKAIPLGGFCDIAGMTPHDELAPEDEPRAMYRQSMGKRLVVLIAGPVQNFILGFVLIIILGLSWGLPILGDRPVYAEELTCVAPTTDAEGAPIECTGPAPAAEAGLVPGDQILAVNGSAVHNRSDTIAKVRDVATDAVLTINHDGQTREVTIPVTQVQRMTQQPDGTNTPVTVSAIGIKLDETAVRHYNAASVWGGAVSFTGDLLRETVQALAKLPTKIDDLWTAVTGGERGEDTPMSVVGASRMGGEVVERGYWDIFLGLLISVNFFLGAFNLVPLLPLDGGHMLIAVYEKVRNLIRRAFGRADAGPVDYVKLLPLTYAVVGVMAVFMVLTIVADVINPIRLFG